MNKTAKRGKNKARNALYLSKWFIPPKATKTAISAKLEPLARGKIK